LQVNIHWIEGVESGRLGIMPRPRGGDWLEDEIRSLMHSGVDVVISLLEREEILEFDLLEEQTLCLANGISFLSFPIRDRNIPSSKREASDFAQSILKLLGSGKSVVIHCRAGIGRSALIAACALTLDGIPVNEAFEKIERARGCSVPDTQEQREWLVGLAKSL
jgi:protein-tyrosine phosphatase